ncbi:ribosome small subunit-dependent GTPase A [Candidatus Fermentibacteria bacterium]|nr:ribosome small subunit-dependent GTPase A [Candidatus Fermentibacteria bacterium]
MSEMEMRVSSVGRRGVTLMTENGSHRSGEISGRVYREGTPVAGDWAVVEERGETLFVVEILPRRKVLARTSSSGSRQVIAANVDLVLVVVSIREPDLDTGFVDRALVSCEQMGLDAAIVLNKIDLEEHDGKIEGAAAPYSKAGYMIFRTSCLTGQGMERLRSQLAGLSVVMTGPSGTGKTSIARSLRPDLDLRVGSLSAKTSTGKHTTVATRLINLGQETILIDTPGLRLFSVSHIDSRELSDCFPEFRPFHRDCRFRDCMHRTEPGCAVMAAVERGEVSRDRYESYLSILEETDRKDQRR